MRLDGERRIKRVVLMREHMIGIRQINRRHIAQLQARHFQRAPQAAPIAIAGAIHADLHSLEVFQLLVATARDMSFGDEAFVDAIAGL